MSLPHLSLRFTGMTPRIESAMKGRYLADIPPEQLLKDLDAMAPGELALNTRSKSRGLTPDQQRSKDARRQKFSDLESELVLRLKEMTRTAAKQLADLLVGLENYTCTNNGNVENAWVEALERPDSPQKK